MAAPTTFYLNIVPEGGCSADKSAYKDRLSSLLQWFSVNSTPFFGNHQYDPNVEPSKIGDILRAKAQFVDQANSQQGGSNARFSAGFSAGGSGAGGYGAGGYVGSGSGAVGYGAGGYGAGSSGPTRPNIEGSGTGSYQTGLHGALSQNLNNFSESLSSSLDATGRFIDSGIAAGKQYGRTVFLGATIVPKTLYDLVAAHHSKNAYLNVQTAQDLSYVSGDPEYLFQFVDLDGNIIPITAEVAHRLVPGFVIEDN
ncbi:hypothetical protein PV328_006357 [Microctonus aethiopoides]|uniref:Uncharacterized protein n=1 Tax=Microctonus aethiopoides TaxID=144406 RepID=A0AA39FNX0_9HYME|nr:hypothetical protein PV328_006357 [Microctonus aethiopoides]